MSESMDNAIAGKSHIFQGSTSSTSILPTTKHVHDVQGEHGKKKRYLPQKDRPKLPLGENKLTIDKNLSRTDIRRRKRNLKKLLKRSKNKKIHPNIVASDSSSDPMANPPINQTKPNLT